jgi:hypothetical protein
MFRSSEKSLADDGSEQRKETGRTNKHSLRVGVREEEARVETRSLALPSKRHRISTFSPSTPMLRFSRRSVRKETQILKGFYLRSCQRHQSGKKTSWQRGQMSELQTLRERLIDGRFAKRGDVQVER